eukprot:3264223-Amphidinium_carterae.2
MSSPGRDQLQRDAPDAVAKDLSKEGSEVDWQLGYGCYQDEVLLAHLDLQQFALTSHLELDVQQQRQQRRQQQQARVKALPMVSPLPGAKPPMQQPMPFGHLACMDFSQMR